MTSQRFIRLNKIVCNEINTLLHTVYRDVAKNISITEVNVSPDMRDAYIYFSVIGDDKNNAQKILMKHMSDLRRRLFGRVKIKFSPRLHFRHDISISRGQHILDILDNL